MKPNLFRLQKYILRLIYKLTALIGIELPPFASASAIIENEKGQVLMVNLSYHQGFSLPGGLLQANESFEAGLKREIKEETNLDVEIKDLVRLYHSYDEFPTVNALYKAEITAGQIESSAEGKVSWQTPVKVIGRIAYSDNRQGLKEYFQLT